VDTPLSSTWSEVWEAAMALAARLSEPDPSYRVSGRIVKLDEKIEEVLQMLRERKRLDFTALVSPWGTRIHEVMSLLACLELAKRSSLRLRQAAPFAPLWLYRRDEKPDAA
jgi:segregation and condensation protein A